MEDLPKQVKYWFSEAKHDFFFLFGPESGPTVRIGVIKTLLMGFSEPLRALLQDSQLAEPGEVRLIDIEAETFHKFLMCVYGGSDVIIPKLSFDESLKLLYIAEKYLVEDLKTKILRHLLETWSYSNIFLALSHPLCLIIDVLQEKMLDTLQKGFTDIVRNEEFYNISDAAMTWILQQDKLNVREVDVWKAVLKWAQYQENVADKESVRLKIFPFLKYIRFLAMDFKDFYLNVVQSGTLVKEEIEEICQSYDTGSIPTTTHLCKNKKHRYTTSLESDNIIKSSLETPNFSVNVFTVNNIRSLKSEKYSYSEPFILDGFTWQLRIKKTYNNKEVNLSVFIAGSNYIRGWPHPVSHTCNMNGTCTLLNQSGKKDFSSVFTHKFTFKDYDCFGWPSFIPWSEVLSPQQGYIKDDKINIMLRLQLTD